MHYRVDRFLPGFPHVAVISCESDPLERGILKFTRRQSEVDVLQHLSKFTCEENHSVPGAQVWTIPSKGFVIYSCFGGSHFTNISKPDVHMWSAARQLIEGVASIHNQGVAHLDIKPANVFIHPDSSRLSIINYNISQFVKPDTKLHAFRGTADYYIAPEVTVKHAEYDPIRADLWSCGKTLEEIDWLLSTTHKNETSFLAGTYCQLDDGADDPPARPMMSEVLKRTTTFESSTLKRPRSGQSTLLDRADKQGWN
ncbi:kinase-like domain-containing protein [Boletus reticuloceps]|uniref:non-specific serine/threonine protein kinase n=1 Tax=Boletus reticuloceps TaxID=495285 RepID=A0A8I3A699_9AGAM|nr:kinase-like domain-containing protein [Boletus reticuloceps]